VWFGFVSAEAFRSSAALPNEKARRNRDGFFPPFALSAANCFVAGLCGRDTFVFSGVLVLRAAVTAEANVSLVVTADSVLIVGLESGEGFAVRFVASDEEPRAGIFTT
jgi:hypothetical protein